MSFWKEYVGYLKDNPSRYWFKRKLFGWGWIPATWQGWLVLFVFIIVMILNALRLQGHLESSNSVSTEFISETFALVLALIGICYKTGEKPRWQWGLPKKEDPKTTVVKK